MSDTIGKFIQPPRHQDVVKPDRVAPVPTITRPKPIPFEPAPPLSVPAPMTKLEPAPALSVPERVEREPAPKLSVPDIIPPEPPPGLSVTASIPFEPAPPPAVPDVIPFEPAPQLDVPPTIPGEPPPALSLPANVPWEPPPILSTPDVVATEPPPVLSIPEKILPQPAPVLSSPVDVPPEVIPRLSVPVTHSFPAADVDTRMHSDDPGVRAAQAGTDATVIGQFLSLDAGVNASVMIPGLGLVPLDSHLSTHGGKVNVGFDLHLKDALDQRVTQLKNAAKDAAARFAVTNIQNFSRYATQQASSLAGGNGLRSGGPVAVPFEVPAAFKADNLIQGTNSDMDPVGPVAKAAPTTEAMAAAGYNQRTQLNFYDEYARAEDWIPDAIDLRRLNDPKVPDSIKQENLRKLYLGSSVSIGSFVDPLRSVSNTKNIFRSQAGGTDAERGFFRVETSNDSKRERDLPFDNEAYVPLVFTDLRPLQGGIYRSVYMRSFLTALSEELQPQWNMQSYFGRVDPVATYQSTNRTISLGFKLVTFSPEELDVNYKKLSWLKSMVYPQYDYRMQYKSGPVVRMRVGDVINAVGKEGNRGLAGVITALSLDYGNATWELLNDRRLPREIEVSLSFHVLHDTPVGLLEGTGPSGSETQFGGIENGKSGADYRRFHLAFGKGDYLNVGKGIKIDPVPNDASGSWR